MRTHGKLHAGVVAVAVAVCVGAALPGGQAQAPADPAAAILAAHKAADEAYLKVPMSPFTAVAVQYFAPGQTLRLGVTQGGGVEFGEAPRGADVVELTLDGDGFLVTPVRGVRPAVAKTSGSRSPRRRGWFGARRCASAGTSSSST
jgi:hypothetical protein